MDLFQEPSTQMWTLVGIALVVVLLVVYSLRRRRSGEEPAPPGLPEAPEGWEPLETEGDSELARAVSRSGAPRARYFRAELPSGQPMALGHTPRYPWVDVFVRRRMSSDPEEAHTGPYEIYSYNLREERWSYGAVPPDAKEIARVVRDGFADYMARTRR